MTDNELLLAISRIMDMKIKPLRDDMQSFKTELRGDMQSFKDEIANDMESFKAEITDDIQGLKSRQTRLEMLIENDVRRDIKLLAENYLSVATRYKTATEEIYDIKSDVGLLKKVVSEHSEQLNRV